MIPILNKEPVKRVEKILKEYDSSIKIIVLEQTARTANDAATALGCKVGAIVKSLLFKAGEYFILCLVSGDNKCSLNKLKKITGFTIGGVSPVGHLKNVNIYVDEGLKRFTNIYAAAGHPNAIFKISFNQIVELTNGEISELSEWEHQSWLITFC